MAMGNVGQGNAFATLDGLVSHAISRLFPPTHAREKIAAMVYAKRENASAIVDGKEITATFK